MRINGEGVVVDQRIPEEKNQVVHDFADGPFETEDPYFIAMYGGMAKPEPAPPHKVRGKK